MSNRKQNKQIIECGFGENCARSTCTFKHPESRNLVANLNKIREEQHKTHLAREQKQMEMIMQRCHHGDLCHYSSCPYRHSPVWNPQENQRLMEEKRRQNEVKRQYERQKALSEGEKETINKHRQGENNSLDDSYEYDEEHFNVYDKIWEKQAERQLDKW